MNTDFFSISGSNSRKSHAVSPYPDPKKMDLMTTNHYSGKALDFASLVHRNKNIIKTKFFNIVSDKYRPRVDLFRIVFE